MEQLAKINADEERRQEYYENSDFNTTDCETIVLETNSELGVEKSIVVKRRQPFICSTPKHNNTMKFYGTSTTELTDITGGFHNNTSAISHSMINSTVKANRKHATKQKETYLNRSEPKKHVTNIVRRKLNTLNSANVSSLVKKFRRLQAMLKVTLTHEGRRRKCMQNVDLAKLQHRYDGTRPDSPDNKSKYNKKSILDGLVDNEKCISGFSSLNGAVTPGMLIDVDVQSLEWRTEEGYEVTLHLSITLFPFMNSTLIHFRLPLH